MMTLCMNLDGRQVSQFWNYNFNSTCKFGDRYFGANTSGIFELETGDLDSTEKIEAFFELPVSDWGVDNQKRIRSVHLGIRTTGEMLLTLTDDNGRAYQYTASPTQVPLKVHGIKIVAGRNNGKGRYWQLRLENIDGIDFTLDSITVYPVILGPVPAGN